MKRESSDPFSALNKGAAVADLDEFERDFGGNPIEEDPLTDTNEDSVEDEVPVDPPVEGSESSTESPEYDIEITGNPIYIIAKKWKEEGNLPEDFEVKEDITEEAFDEALYTFRTRAFQGLIAGNIGGNRGDRGSQ